MENSSKFSIYNGFRLIHHYDHVDWDEVKSAQGSKIIGTDGVNNCLVITLYDPSTKKGSLAHIMNLWKDSPKECRPENIIDTMLESIDLSPDSPNLSTLEATLSGENPRDFEPDVFMWSIVKPILAKYNIPIIGEDLGEITDKIYSPFLPLKNIEPGRLVFLYCETGNVEVYRA